jgi:hypothetical protein
VRLVRCAEHFRAILRSLDFPAQESPETSRSHKALERSGVFAGLLESERARDLESQARIRR